MSQLSKFLTYWRIVALFIAASALTTGCATGPAASVPNFQGEAGSFSLPYTISTSGRYLIDVSINDRPARPLSLDTGATVSVLYSGYARTTGLDVSDRTRFVRGLVGQGDRPVIEDVAFEIGGQAFALDEIVTLKTPRIKDEAVGLIGGDILSGYIVMFDREMMTVSFAPRETLTEEAFAGWNIIPLRTLADTPAQSQLYFTDAVFDDKSATVLIDTGSNLNFINWKLATLDEEIGRLEREMIRNGTLQGALDSTSATLDTVLYDLRLGDHRWDEVPVVVTALNGLATIAPVDEAMIVAGAKLFTPHTIALDLDGRRLYVYPKD